MNSTVPAPPADPEIKNIIDKLSNFVARNGYEFENVTKLKQKDNPKFRFLFGEEYHDYYQYMVGLERENILKQHQQQQQQQQPDLNAIPLPNQLSSNEPPTVASLQTKINTLKGQISESETNLNAQNDVFQIKKKIQTEETLKQQSEKVSHLLADSKVDVTTLEQICNRIVQSCSRDAIQTGKNFVFTKHLPDEKQVEATCFYLKQRILNEDITGESRLHLVYFMNELLSHAHKNKIDLIKKQMEKVIIPCFCQTALTLDKEKSPKIDKLLDIWEKTKYFPVSVLDKLKKPADGMKFYEDKMSEEKQQIIQTIEEDYNNQFKQLENQHKEFVNHAQGQINKLHGQIAQIQLASVQIPPPLSLPPALAQLMPPTIDFKNLPPPLPPHLLMMSMAAAANPAFYQNMGQFSQPPPGLFQPPMNPAFAQPPPSSPLNQQQQPPKQQQAQQQSQPQALMSLMSLNTYDAKTENNANNNNSNSSTSSPQPLMNSLSNFNVPPPTSSNTNTPPYLMNINMSIPPPSSLANDSNLDLTRPPPSSSDHPSVMPSFEMPYHKLPAGLMVEFIKVDDYEYEPLDPSLFKLPQLEMPSENLLKAVDDFYNLNNPNKTRNPEGWEKNGLYEFYKAKITAQIAKKKVQKENEQEKPQAEPSSDQKSKRKSRSKSKSKRKHKSSNRHKRRSYSSSSSSSSSSRSSSRSSRSSSSSRSRTRSRSRSRSRSRTKRGGVQGASSPSPRPYQRRRSRSKTPPPISSAFLTSAPIVSAVDLQQQRRLDMSNKGHQLLSKMGWSGQAGLGRNEQGIFNPIEGGHVRERNEQFRGVGATGSRNDPFEAFRQNRSKTYIQRLRDRDEQKEMNRKLNSSLQQKDENLDY